MKQNDLYSGFVPLNSKAAMIKFKGVPAVGYEEAEHWSGANGIGGILKPNVVLVDIDDDLQFEKALSIIREKQYPVVVRKTSRGGHITALNNGDEAFNKCGTRKTLAIGLSADIKTGKEACYQALKVDGIERNIIYEADEIGEIPKAFEPVQTGVDFVSLGEGDGRNQALFTHILTLSRAGMNKDEIKEIITMMNQFVLREPLSEDELETVLRDGAFPNMDEIFFEKRTFRHDRLGQFLIHKMNIVFIDGQIHSYADGFYIPGSRAIECEIATMIPLLKDSQIKETLSYIKRIAKTVYPAPPKYIGFANGILDIESGIMHDFSPDIVITNKIPWNYDPAAYSELVDKCLNEWACNDPAIRSLLEEITGYCLYRTNIFQKMFILTGEKANGKSTFLDMITRTIGADNCSALDLGSVGKRFGTAQLAGKLVNIGDDISDDFIDGANTAIIKKIVTGERLTAEFKGRDLFEFSPYAKMIFSANDIPRMKDRTGAMLRRLVIVPFNAKFSKSDPNLREKLKSKEAMETMLKYAVQGLQRLLDRGEFTQSTLVQAELKSFEISNDPIKAFLKDYLQVGDELFRNSIFDIYKAYQIYCVENGYKSVNKNLFGRYVKKEYGLETYSKSLNGKIMKMYRRIS